MIKETKEAFLRHDLYKLRIESDGLERAYSIDNAPKVEHVKVASKGARFVYCDTDRKDNQHGWYADPRDKRFTYAQPTISRPRVGACGFGIMSNAWAQNNLTEPTPLTDTKFRNPW